MQPTDFDALTGLYNRRFALVHLEFLCLEAARQNSKVGLLFLDIDCMQRFNDQYGHGAGDRLLHRWARVLEGIAEEFTLVARFGGEKFALFVPDAEISALMELAQCIRARIASATVSYYGKKFGPLTVTIGVACFPDDAQNAIALIEGADEANYFGKSLGRNCVVSVGEAKPEIMKLMNERATICDNSRAIGRIAF